MAALRQATNMIVVPPRLSLVTQAMVDHLAKDLQAELPAYKFLIVPDYIGRQSHEFFVEPDGWVPDEAVAALRSVLARYGDGR
jgi:hypothetical protein